MFRRLLACVIATIALAAASAAPAAAWWAEGSSYHAGAFGNVIVTAEPGETNHLTAIGTPGLGVATSVILRDDAATVTPAPDGHGAGCTQIDAHTLSCTGIEPFAGGAIGVDYLELALGDGDDSIDIPAASMPIFLIGGTGVGDDSVRALDLNGASIDLSDGNDELTLRGNQSGFTQADSISGGSGDDKLDVMNMHDDHPYCGDGNDVLYADRGEGAQATATCEVVHEGLGTP
jgi:hypothetical protein